MYVVVCLRIDMYALRHMFVGARMFECLSLCVRAC